MADIWFTSDHHFSHANIIKHCNRPYSSVFEMDWDMVEKWNSVVKPDDTIYHLGDVYLKASHGYIDNLLSKLNGHKRLVIGNHDNGKDQILLRRFEKISLWRVFKDQRFVCSHIPLAESSFIGRATVNVHGHIHDRPAPSPRHINVSVEQTNYTPVHLDEILRMING